MKKLVLPLVFLVLGIALGTGIQYGMKPTQASPAEVIDLIGDIDEASEDIKAPSDLEGVADYQLQVGYNVANLERWVKKSPAQEPLLNALGGLIADLKHSPDSMKFAFTANHVTATSEEVAEDMARKARERLARMRGLAMASLASRK